MSKSKYPILFYEADMQFRLDYENEWVLAKIHSNPQKTVKGQDKRLRRP